MIVPTNIPLGIRVRVVTAWSFGCPIVAHRANAAGIPEMQDGENALLADTDAELADAVSRALGDEALRGNFRGAVDRPSRNGFRKPWQDRPSSTSWRRLRVRTQRRRVEAVR